MTAYTVRFTPRATADVNGFFAQMAARTPLTAERWLTGVQRTVDSLDRFPERCPLVAESRWLRRLGRTVRETYHGKRRNTYRILFEVIGTEVLILRVRHGRQRRLRPGEL